MNDLFPIWLLPFWIFATPLVFAIVELVRTPRTDRSYGERGYVHRSLRSPAIAAAA